MEEKCRETIAEAIEVQKKTILRKPGEEELGELRDYLLSLGSDEESVDMIITNHWFAVFEDYISDCPGYRGKILFAIYGCPEFHEVFGWIDEKLTKIDIDKSMIPEED